MLCTNFNSMSSYYEMQQKVYGDMIKQRVIMRESKDKHDKIVRLVKEKTKAYMEKRRSM